MSAVKAMAPGSVIGILGGGQLGRMLALAAAQIGLKVHIYAPEKDSPAFEVAYRHSCADYLDRGQLAEFAKSVDVITYEFENVPVQAVQYLETLKPVRPNSQSLQVAQDRIQEKTMARSLGAMTAEFAAVNSREELDAAVARIGLPAILKTTRLGYDGKGQAKILQASDIEGAWAALKGVSCILERFVDFQAEVSVIAARGVDGTFAAYDVTENVHRNHILHTSSVPAAVDDSLQTEAVYVAQQIMTKLNYVGVLAVEYFVGPDLIYVNEIAPRVHNSGHWTMDGCVVSQFEQHIRAIAGWPLGYTRRHSDVIMTNLLGDEAGTWEKLAAEPAVGLHLYGKAQARPGRKMGHFNALLPRSR